MSETILVCVCEWVFRMSCVRRQTCGRSAACLLIVGSWQLALIGWKTMTLAIVWRSCCSIIIIIIMSFVGNGAENGIDMPVLKRPISDNNNNNKKRRSSSPLVLTAAMSNEFAIFATAKNTISGKNSTMPIWAWDRWQKQTPLIWPEDGPMVGRTVHQSSTVHSRCSVTKLTSAQVIPFENG